MRVDLRDPSVATTPKFLSHVVVNTCCCATDVALTNRTFKQGALLLQRRWGLEQLLLLLLWQQLVLLALCDVALE